MTGLPWWCSGKESACRCKRRGFNPWSQEDSPGVENGNPLHCSRLKNPMDRGAWQAILHGVAKSQTQLSMHAHHDD